MIESDAWYPRRNLGPVVEGRSDPARKQKFRMSQEGGKRSCVLVENQRFRASFRRLETNRRAMADSGPMISM
jgi:hypothetical protein